VAPIRAFVPITAGRAGDVAAALLRVNIAAILLWAPAHILPACSRIALERAGGLVGLEGTAKHYWMPLVFWRCADRGAYSVGDPPPPRRQRH